VRVHSVCDITAELRSHNSDQSHAMVTDVSGLQGKLAGEGVLGIPSVQFSNIGGAEVHSSKGIEGPGLSGRLQGSPPSATLDQSSHVSRIDCGG